MTAVSRKHTPRRRSDRSDTIHAKLDDDLLRRQVNHDIRHQLSTVVLLATTLNTSIDVGPAARARVGQLLLETKWLAELFRLYDEEFETSDWAEPDPDEGTRLDVVADDVLRPIRMSSRRDVVLEAMPVVAFVQRLGLWRALRNIVGNAMTAAGPDGRVIVRVFSAAGRAIVEVHDSGPGFDARDTTVESLGLAIVRTFVRNSGGTMTIGRGTLKGCVVRLELPGQA
jgi:signal transduction histidine kinase